MPPGRGAKVASPTRSQSTTRTVATPMSWFSRLNHSFGWATKVPEPPSKPRLNHFRYGSLIVPETTADSIIGLPVARG